MICFGGLRETAAYNIMKFSEEIKSGNLTQECDIAVVDWPEYGRSIGRVSSGSLKSAAAEITEHFSNMYSEVVLVGYSMGTGYAVHAAQQCSVDDMILLAPYADASDLCNSAIKISSVAFTCSVLYNPPCFGGKNAECRFKKQTGLLWSADDAYIGYIVFNGRHSL